MGLRVRVRIRSDSALVVIEHDESHRPSQDWIDGYQAALVEVDRLHPYASVLWTRDPAVLDAAVARFDAWRAGLDTRTYV